MLLLSKEVKIIFVLLFFPKGQNESFIHFVTKTWCSTEIAGHTLEVFDGVRMGL